MSNGMPCGPPEHIHNAPSKGACYLEMNFVLTIGRILFRGAIAAVVSLAVGLSRFCSGQLAAAVGKASCSQR